MGLLFTSGRQRCPSSLCRMPSCTSCSAQGRSRYGKLFPLLQPSQLATCAFPTPQSSSLPPFVAWAFLFIYPVLLATSVSCDFLRELGSTLQHVACMADGVVPSPEALQPALLLLLFGAVFAKIGVSHSQAHPLPSLSVPPVHSSLAPSSSDSSSDDSCGGDDSEMADGTARASRPPSVLDARVQLLRRLAARAGNGPPPTTEAHLDLADALLSRPLQHALRELSIDCSDSRGGIAADTISGAGASSASAAEEGGDSQPSPLRRGLQAPLDDQSALHQHSHGVRKFNHALRSIGSASCPDVAALAAVTRATPHTAQPQPQLPHVRLAHTRLRAPELNLPPLPSLSSASLPGAPTLLSAAGVPSAFLFAPRPPPQPHASMRRSISTGAFLAANPMHVAGIPVSLPGQRVQRPVPVPATPPPSPPEQGPPLQHALADLAYAVVHAAHSSKRMSQLRQTQGRSTLCLSAAVAAVPMLTRVWHGGGGWGGLPPSAHTLSQALGRPGVALALLWRSTNAAMLQPWALVGACAEMASGLVRAAPCLLAGWAAAHCAVALLQYILHVATMRQMIAKRFGSLTSPLAARKACLPLVPLAAPAHVTQWLALRGLLRRRGSLRGIDSGIRWLVFITLACLFLLMFLVNDADASSTGAGGGEAAAQQAVLFNSLAVWTLVLCAYVTRFIALSDSTARKFRSTSVLQAAQVNAHAAAAEGGAAGGGSDKQASRLLGLLKATEALLKEMEQPGRLTGVKLSPALYSAVRIAALSAVSALVAKVLGFNVRLWKSLATKGG